MRPRTIPQTTIDAMRADYNNTEMSVQEISDKYGVNYGMTSAIVYNYAYHCVRYTPKMRNNRAKVNNNKWVLSEWQVRDIRTNDIPDAELAENHQLPIHVVRAVRNNLIYHSPTYIPVNKRNKLSEKQIHKIMTSKKTQAELAMMFNVSQPCISYYRRKLAQTA